MNGYRQMIVDATGCKPEDAGAIEELMRDVVFHSTLDWQTRAQFRAGARAAAKVLAAMDTEDPEGAAFYRKAGR